MCRVRHGVRRAFVVPSPLGGNVGRLPLLLAVPLVLLADPRRLRPVLLLVPVVVGCQTIEVAQVASASIADQSTTPDYYDGVLRYLRGVPGPVRVEIPATTQHWESVYVGATVEMARGWERQLDRRLNPEFYDRDHPLDAARYQQWLLREWRVVRRAPGHVVRCFVAGAKHTSCARD